MDRDWKIGLGVSALLFATAFLAGEPQAAELERYEPKPAEIAFAQRAITTDGGTCISPRFAIDIHDYAWWIDCKDSFWIIDENGDLFRFRNFEEAYAIRGY